jgi:hypothetical protein
LLRALVWRGRRGSRPALRMGRRAAGGALVTGPTAAHFQIGQLQHGTGLLHTALDAWKAASIGSRRSFLALRLRPTALLASRDRIRGFIHFVEGKPHAVNVEPGAVYVIIGCCQASQRGAPLHRL